MRSGIFIAIAVAIVVFVAGIFWFNSQPDEVALDEQLAEQAEQIQREGEDAALVDVEEQPVEESAAPEADQAAAPEEDTTGLVDDDAIVVGDRVTDDTVVVESETDEPVILDPDEVATSTEMVDDAASPGSADTPAATADAGDATTAETPATTAEAGDGTAADTPAATAEAGDGTAADTPAATAEADDATSEDTPAATAEAGDAPIEPSQTGEASVEVAESDDAPDAVANVGDETADTDAGMTADTTADRADPEQLLTPEGFDQDEVLALIAESEDLTDTQRSSLSAMVRGADANPSMMEATIRSIRTALDLPPLN